jgi:DNA-binding winged helix-turn-helix (wHTH) protein/tetratricopeptide (TPR) repeat protein
VSSDTPRRYEFGSFAVDAHRRTLRDERGLVVEIPAKAFDALVYLVEHAGVSVSRAELLDALWPATIIEDNTLSRTIMQVRRALGEEYVVTIKGRGYQFVADVRPVGAEPGDSPRARGARRSGVPRAALVGVGIAAGAVVLVAVLRLVAPPDERDNPTPDPVTRYSSSPTADGHALELYLSGRTYERIHNDWDSELVARQYQRAVELDPTFALAWARLSIIHNEIFWFRRDASQARRQLARDAAMRAITLQPDLPEARMALGWYHYHVEQDARAAVAELKRAVAGMPGDEEAHWRLGIVYRRYGELEKALAEFEKLYELGPADRRWLFAAVEIHLLLRQYPEAQELCDRLLEVAPDHSATLTYKALIPLYRDGDARALSAAASDPAFDTRNPWVIPRPIMRWMAAIFERNFESALAALDAWHEEAWRDGRRYFSHDGLQATTFELTGRPARAGEGWQRALAHVEGVLDQNPDYPDARMARAEALARAGDPATAVAEAHRVIEHFEAAGDRISAAEHRLDAVRRVFAPTGALDDALAGLERYLAEPGMWSVEGLVADPRLEPLRGDPRFVGLVDRYRRDTTSR